MTGSECDDPYRAAQRALPLQERLAAGAPVNTSHGTHFSLGDWHHGLVCFGVLDAGAARHASRDSSGASSPDRGDRFPRATAAAQLRDEPLPLKLGASAPSVSPAPPKSITPAGAR